MRKCKIAFLGSATMHRDATNYRAFVAILFLFAPIFLFSQEISQSLNSNWQFSEAGKNEWMKATVPGTIHTDLLANKKIPDPNIGTNEAKVQWVETKTWEYKTTFDADARVLKYKHKELVFEGLDTYAFVYLNDSLILRGENMFLTYRIEVSKFLKKENNKLRIVFHPASELIEKNKAQASIKNLPGGDRVFIRKAQYQFGWDFGPRLVTCGIWKNVKLEGWGYFNVTTILTTTSIQKDTAYLQLQISLGAILPKDHSAEIIFSEGNKVLGHYTERMAGRLMFPGFVVKIPKPRLWWCNGMGKQNVYHFTCTIIIGKQTIVKQIDYAIRTITLKTKEDANGSSFIFYLNNKPVFMKGANWIPCDNFIPRVSSEKYYSLLKSAQQSNFNMLRVWGGGVYEDEMFYDNCDSLGILVWQDFMFAGGCYPDGEDFKNTVVDETKMQYKRLSKHPCIAIWCGNNEIKEAWQDWGWEKEMKISSDDSTSIWNNQLHIFQEQIPEIIHSLNPNTNYTPTSPLTGWGHPAAYKSGDVHYWGVWWGDEPFSSYDNHVGRFMSEYGFQAWPAFSSVKLFDTTDNFLLSDSILLAHQKNEKAFEKMDLYMQRDYPISTDFSDFKTTSDFSDYIYISQVMQRDGISRAINAHRRSEPNCMGTLFWQFNDCWPGITWSSNDYYGQPKLLNYALKDLYAPLLISITERNDSVFICLINDDTILHRGTLEFKWLSFDGKIAQTLISPVTAHVNSDKIVLAFENKFLFEKLPKEKGLINVTFHYENKKSVSANHYFTNTKSLALEKESGIITEINPIVNSKGGYKLEIKTQSLAKDVYFSIDDVETKFSDNGFDLLPGEKKEIVITSNLSLEELKKQLKIQTMNSFVE